MDESILGAKEFYDVVLRAYNKMDINGRTIEAGEVIGRFDNINIVNMSERKSYRAARGGNGNQELVFWDETQLLSVQFSQGVFSERQLSILINAKLAASQQIEHKIPYNEQLETDENGQIKLKKVPIQEKLFIYDKLTGMRINEYTLEDNIITLNESYQEVVVDYYSVYENKTTLVQVGLPLTNGFLSLEGKTRLKDDNTGRIVTGIFTIPKLKLKTGLSIQLGNSSAPMVGTFYGEGYPVGRKGHTPVCNLLILSDEIDSDI